ncbi:hypothetical protein BFN01_06215 [Microbacterium sp. AR7-10]|nr:hypothetical protein BFN01_06215 [Microbacterium sp. AR7-10]
MPHAECGFSQASATPAFPMALGVEVLPVVVALVIAVVGTVVRFVAEQRVVRRDTRTLARTNMGSGEYRK